MEEIKKHIRRPSTKALLVNLQLETKLLEQFWYMPSIDPKKNSLSEETRSKKLKVYKQVLLSHTNRAKLYKYFPKLSCSDLQSINRKNRTFNF